jgi:hypothetical protein
VPVSPPRMANPLDKFIPELEPAWMRPPLWRWLEASEFLVNPRAPVTDATDEVVRGAAYYLRARQGQQGVPVARHYPAYHLAYRLWGLSSNFGGMRWQVEAMMLAGLSDKWLAQHIPMFAGETVFRLYRQLYFDIESYRDNPFAVMSNIFAVSHSRHGSDFDVDLTWKMLAYELKDEFPLLLRGVMGGQMPDNIKKRLQELTNVRAIYARHHMVANMGLEFNEQALALLGPAKENFYLNDATVDGIKDQRLASTCESLLKSINLVVLDSEKRLSAIERLQEDVDMKALAEHFTVK